MGKTQSEPAQNRDAKRGSDPAHEAELRRQAEGIRELVAKWEHARRTMTPEEKAQADRDWEIFKKAMNEGRPKGMEHYPD